MSMVKALNIERSVRSGEREGIRMARHENTFVAAVDLKKEFRAVARAEGSGAAAFTSLRQALSAADAEFKTGAEFFQMKAEEIGREGQEAASLLGRLWTYMRKKAFEQAARNYRQGRNDEDFVIVADARKADLGALLASDPVLATYFRKAEFVLE